VKAYQLPYQEPKETIRGEGEAKAIDGGIEDDL